MANGTVVLNEISAPKIAAKAKPGQFVILKANETGERIPLTMADTDPKKGTPDHHLSGGRQIDRSVQVPPGGRTLPGCHRSLGPAHASGKAGAPWLVWAAATGVAVMHPITRVLRRWAIT